MKSVPISSLVPAVISPADLVIELFGGIREAARVLDVSPTNVMRWKRRRRAGEFGLVPREYWKKILEEAQRREKRLSLEELVWGRVGITRRVITFGPHKASPKVEPIGALGSMARALTRMP